MTKSANSSVERTASALGDLVGEFRDEIGRSPSLGELLEVIGLSVPSGDAMGGVPVPLRLAATMANGKRYRERVTSRVDDLNDAVFALAANLLAGVGEDLRLSDGSVLADDVAAHLLAALQHSDAVLADARCDDVGSLVVVGPKKSTRAAIGDVVAIPANEGGFHFATIVARNRFGTAIGVWRGIRTTPVVRTADEPIALRVLYTDEYSIRDGTWPIAGHSQQALSLFPAEPEFYYPPSDDHPATSPKLGEFGSAVTANGSRRDVSREEAERIGLLDGRYQQVYSGRIVADELAARS